MKTYWDSSAIIEAVQQPQLKARLKSERGITRPHALAETFSTLTGNPVNRIDADSAAAIIANLSLSLDFVDLTAEEMLAAFNVCKKIGVRGGRVHDFMHAVAAAKGGAEKIITLDENDFEGLTKIEIELA